MKAVIYARYSSDSQREESIEGQLRECDEGVLEWIDKKKLFDLQQWEGDKIFLRLMDMRVPFFSLKLVYEGDALTAAVLNGERIR